MNLYVSKDAFAQLGEQKVRELVRYWARGQALAAAARSAETNEDLAQSEGRQSGPSESEGNAQ